MLYFFQDGDKSRTSKAETTSSVAKSGRKHFVAAGEITGSSMFWSMGHNLLLVNR